MVSLIIPYHDMENGAFFLKRAIDSVMSQSFKDHEIILTKEGRMAENTNAGIKKANGDIIKILYMDDYLYHKDSLAEIAANFKGGWMATACIHDDGEVIANVHNPFWNQSVPKGVNTIGSPSVIAFENNDPELFNEELDWVLDCELYGRLFKRYGPPTILHDVNVAMGIHSGQMTRVLTDDQKHKEVNYLLKK